MNNEQLTDEQIIKLAEKFGSFGENDSGIEGDERLWIADESRVIDFYRNIESALRAHPAAAQPVATDAELIEAFIAHNPQFLRSSDHPRWLSCKDGDGNWTSLRGDLFAASLRHLIESAK